jgi:hypothetical protein
MNCLEELRSELLALDHKISDKNLLDNGFAGFPRLAQWANADLSHEH